MSITVLAFDAATTACTAALLVEDKVYEFFEIAPRRHSELIIEMINNLLVNADIKLQNVDVIAFGCGPGSFMGVRIATGVAQGLAFGIEKPVIAVSTLQTLAQTAYEETKAENILTGWDARMDEIYWGTYQLNKNGLMKAVMDDCLDKPNAIRLPLEKEWLAVGNAWEIYEEQLPEEIKRYLISFNNDIYPHAGVITKIALEKYQQGSVLPPEKAEPMYLRNKVTHD